MGTPSPITTVVEPGLYQGVAYAEYALWDAAHHSMLRHFNRTPAHAREAILKPEDATPALELGKAIHSAVLEPDSFARRCVAAPKVDRRTTIGKARWSDFQAANIGKTVLEGDEYLACLKIRDSVWAHPTARQLLDGAGLNEVSALWKDAGTGLPCKARFDRLATLSDWSVVVDLKSTRNASPRAFSRDLHGFQYHQQGAFYLDGCQALAPRDRKFLFIAVETDAPYAVAVYELDQDAIEVGRDEYRKHLAEYARCCETGVWPGYAEGVGYISLPSWALKFHDEVS